MEKTDYKKLLREFYAPKVDRPEVVTVPKMNFLMIDGKGDPNTSQDYTNAIQTLYPMAYTIKFISKKLGHDFSVLPLEGLWWTEDMHDFSTENKGEWLWRAMIMQPEVVTQAIYEQAREQIAAKKELPPSLDKVRFEPYDEGRAAQVMYLGPYSEEGPAIKKLHDFIAASGGTLTATNKHHHEIYMSDPRRTAPAKIKTIIRQPF